MATQTILFGDLQNKVPTMHNGFRYEEDIISEADEAVLVASLSALDLKPFEFHGHVGNRRVTSFGLRYDHARPTVEPTEQFPPFIEELRKKAADFAGSNINEIRQGGVNEYPPGAGIGWHKDKSQFGVIVGFRFWCQQSCAFAFQQARAGFANPKYSNHDRSIFWKAKFERDGRIVFRPSSRYATHLRLGL